MSGAATAATNRHARFLAIIAHLRPRVTAHLQGAPPQAQPTPAEYLRLCAELATLETGGGLRLGPISTVWRLALTGCGQIMSQNATGAEATFASLHRHCSMHPATTRFPAKESTSTSGGRTLARARAPRTPGASRSPPTPCTGGGIYDGVRF